MTARESCVTPVIGAAGLSLALTTCIVWNLTLWWNGRRKKVVPAA